MSGYNLKKKIVVAVLALAASYAPIFVARDLQSMSNSDLISKLVDEPKSEIVLDESSDSYNYSLEDIMNDSTQSRTNLDLNDYLVPVPELDFLAQLPSREGDGFVRHPVSNGETYISIAMKHTGLPESSELYNIVNEIIAMDNNRRWPNFGDVLKLPFSSENIEDVLPYSELNEDQREFFLQSRTTPASHDYISDIIEISEKYGIDARIPMAIASVESGFDNTRISGMGAQTMFQLMPNYHGTFDNHMDALKASLDYFKHDLYNRFLRLHNGDETSALISSVAAYNVGPTRVSNWIESGLWDGRTIDQIPRNGDDNIGYSTETRKYTDDVINKILIDLYNVDLDI